MTQQPMLARNEIDPLLDQLIRQLDDEGRATQRAWFARIRRSLQHAQDEVMLAQPIIALSTSGAYGIQLSQEAQPLHTRIVEKAALVVSALDTPPVVRH
jgi:hypothetical protein